MKEEKDRIVGKIQTVSLVMFNALPPIDLYQIR